HQVVIACLKSASEVFEDLEVFRHRAEDFGGAEGRQVVDRVSHDGSGAFDVRTAGGFDGRAGKAAAQRADHALAMQVTRGFAGREINPGAAPHTRTPRSDRLKNSSSRLTSAVSDSVV